MMLKGRDRSVILDLSGPEGREEDKELQKELAIFSRKMGNFGSFCSRREGRRQRAAERIGNFLKIRKENLEKLIRRGIFRPHRVFGSTIPDIVKVRNTHNLISKGRVTSRHHDMCYRHYINICTCYCLSAVKLNNLDISLYKSRTVASQIQSSYDLWSA